MVCMKQISKFGKEKQELIEILRISDSKIYSCGCPYLALSDELGYITAYAVKHDSKLGLSNFGRLSVKKMLKTAGFSDKLVKRYSQFIYECLESGYSLHKIAEKIAQKMLYKYDPIHDQHEMRLKREC